MRDSEGNLEAADGNRNLRRSIEPAEQGFSSELAGYRIGDRISRPHIRPSLGDRRSRYGRAKPSRPLQEIHIPFVEPASFNFGICLER